MFVTVIMTVIHSITSEETGHALSIVTGKRVGATLLCGWLVDWIALTCHVIILKLHSIGAPTQPLEVWCWVAQVAAVPVGMGGLVAVVRP